MSQAVDIDQMARLARILQREDIAQRSITDMGGGGTHGVSIPAEWQADLGIEDAETAFLWKRPDGRILLCPDLPPVEAIEAADQPDSHSIDTATE